MAQKMVVASLTRLTFVRKGRAMAKHPDMRKGVIEVVKSEDISPWYADFDDWLSLQDDLSADPLADFSEGLKLSAKNYPDSEGPFAGPHNSFPIRSAADVVHAAQRLHNAKGNKATIKARIRAIAKEKGYPLPSTWKTTEKSVSDPRVLDLVNQLLSIVKSEDLETVETPVDPATPETPPEAPAAETPAVTETPAPVEAPPAEGDPAPETEAVEKAKTPKDPPHNHNHSHVTGYGYTYSHEHPHGDAAHAEADDHYTSETAHAHEHVAKAADEETEANLKGLAADLAAALENVRVLAEKVSSLETAKAGVVKASREPMVAPTASANGAARVEKSTPRITPDMKFDDAFDIAMGRVK
jgi:hypothetical protein